ncbi:MAG: isoprenyl transferase [Gammaproteobacteria bacterium]|nr:isoprenyl transferase [Gammaproteobacteria bacterium]
MAPHLEHTQLRLPRHIAIILDGNGRWAQKKGLPRIAGHHAGVKAVRKVVQACAERGIEALTLFAFSSENWTRPEDEVAHLMKLFLTVLQREINQLHKNQVRIRFMGDTTHFHSDLLSWIHKTTQLTSGNTGLKLNLAIDYGGRWDILEATKKIAAQVQAGLLTPEAVTSDLFASYLSTANLPEPDLFIRTSGEQRISNFLLWQLAYTELYFTSKHWPDFDEAALDDALRTYSQRDRRYGKVVAAAEQA